jgi:hypothetical protein
MGKEADTMTISSQQPSPVQAAYSAYQTSAKAASTKAPQATPQSSTQEADSVQLSPAARAHIDADHDGDSK